MKTKVYLFDTLKDAERLFKEFIKRTDNGGEHEYRWTGYMGSFDLDDNRIYCMPNDKFEVWKKTHSDYVVANGDGVFELLKKKSKLEEI